MDVNYIKRKQSNYKAVITKFKGNIEGMVSENLTEEIKRHYCNNECFKRENKSSKRIE